MFFKIYFSNVNLFIFSFFEPNFIEKFLWESVFFKIWPKWKWREIKIGYLAAILKRYNISIVFVAELWFFIARTYMVQISFTKFRWENGFLGGSMEPPLGTNGSKSTFVT